MKINRDVKLFLYSLFFFIVGQILAFFRLNFSAIVAQIASFGFVFWAIKVLRER